MARIIRYPNEILLRKSEPVRKFDKNLARLGRVMIDSINDKNGSGLAAVQIGEPVRLIAMANPENRKGKAAPILLANPEISSTDGEITGMEGCFSLPGLWLEIPRPEAVEINAFSIDGSPLSMRFTGYLARGVIHEIDHLDGKLIWDILPAVKKEEAVKKYLSTVKQAPGTAARRRD